MTSELYCKINTRKSLDFLYSENETERENQGVDAIYNCTRNHRIMRKNLNQKGMDVQSKHCRSLMEDSKEDTNRLKIFLFID